MVIKPYTPDLDQIQQAANSPAMMPDGISAMQSEQIASSIMDIPQVSYQEPRAARVVRRAAQPRLQTSLMQGKYPSGILVAPSVPHEFEGTQYMSTPLDMGTTKRPDAPAKPRKESSTKQQAPSTEAKTTTIENKNPFAFTFNFNFAGTPAPDIAKQIQQAIEDKLPDITSAVREAIGSTRLQYSY